MVYDSFEAWMQAVVIPRRAENPSLRRLDGQTAGSNRDSAGRFRHRGKTWNVHADTHFEPLELAHAALAVDSGDPFVEEPTKSGRSLSLKLRPELRARMSSKYAYLYVYDR